MWTHTPHPTVLMSSNKRRARAARAEKVAMKAAETKQPQLDGPPSKTLKQAARTASCLAAWSSHKKFAKMLSILSSCLVGGLHHLSRVALGSTLIFNCLKVSGSNGKG